MIKIQPIVRDIVLSEIEAYIALSEGYMNMSSYAHKIRPIVETYTKKEVTITSLVISLSRLKTEFKKQKPLIQDVEVRNITTKLPITEIVYENSDKFIQELGTLYKEIHLTREDFFVATISINEMNIIVSSNMANKVIKHFKTKPKIINNNFAAVGISLNEDTSNTPNIFFSLLSVTAKARINIEELVSTSTELVFIIAEKDFSTLVTLFSKLYKK